MYARRRVAQVLQLKLLERLQSLIAPLLLRGRLPQRREFHGAKPAGLRAAVEVGRDAGRVLRERDQSAC